MKCAEFCAAFRYSSSCNTCAAFARALIISPFHAVRTLSSLNGRSRFSRILNNLSLRIFDAYRPQRSVNYFINWSKDLSDTINKIIYYPEINKSQLFPMGYIAERSGHSRGSTVDLTIVNNKTNKELDMGTPYDFFGPESSTDFSNITDKQRSNRILLLEAMTKNGFKNYPKEWWHYTLELEPFNYYFNFVID